jgi:predicted Ser/Thr protein kinase
MSKLETYSMTKLKEIASKLGIKPKRGKADTIKVILDEMKEYEEYKKEKLDKYTRLHQLGNKGKEGTTYLVSDAQGKKYAMKTFRSGKSSKNLKKEYKFLKKASEKGISPPPYDYDTVSKYIVMEKMDVHLKDMLKKPGFVLSKSYQLRILEIYKTLDELGIFHNDGNLQNYMLKNKKLYIIDFGLAKKIDKKLIKSSGNTPNYRLMTLGFIIKMQELKMPEKSYKYLMKTVSKEDRANYGLN